MNTRMFCYICIALLTLCFTPTTVSEAQLFDPSVEYGAGDWPYSVAIGNLDADGYQDLVAGHYYDPVISLLKSHGDGTFQDPEIHPYIGQSRSVVLDDFDGDSDLDVALGNSGNQCATVLLNTTVAAELGTLELVNTKG